MIGQIAQVPHAADVLLTSAGVGASSFGKTPARSPPVEGLAIDGLDERLELANQLYREFHTRCFWHCPQTLEITEELIPFVVKGLRACGRRRGFILASRLLPIGARDSRDLVKDRGCGKGRLMMGSCPLRAESQQIKRAQIRDMVA